MGNNLNVCHTEEVKKGENSRMKEAKENLTVSGTTGEAMVSMIICMIILIIFIIFFCLLPLYRLLERRWGHWDQVENDPRWNVDTFQFSASAAANKHSRKTVTDNITSLQLLLIINSWRRLKFRDHQVMINCSQ